MKKFIFTFLLMLMPVMHVMGIVYYTYVDGLYYDFKSDGTAAVSPHIKYGRGEYSQDYSGDVVIPPTVTYNKRTYRVTSINEGAFSHCSDLNSVTIPNSITYIGYEAFYYWHSLNSIYITDLAAWCNIKDDDSCLSYSHLFLNGEEVKDLVIPNGVTSIKLWTFRGCKSLTSLTIPNSVTSIEDHPFSGCVELESISVGSGNQYYDSRNNCNAIIMKSTNTLIQGCKNTIIPNSVTSICDYAFDGCSGLTSINIPNSVTSIGISAFSGCSGLTSINIPNSVTSIDGGAFSGCSSLTSVTIPNSVTSIGDKAFQDCSGLTSITIPNSVTSIDYSAFSSCSGLTSITVENDNQYYDSRNNCNAIIRKSTNTLIVGCKNTIIPKSVTSIGGYAFYRCSGLTSITISNSVTSIGGGAFWYCSGLMSVIIGNSVTSIDNAAFRDCSGLTSILSLNNTPPTCYSLTFYNVDKENCVVWVPKGSIAAYMTADGWKDFTKIKEIVDGDVNLDEKVNRYDQNALVAHIMGEKPEGFYEGLADLNGDDDVNAADVVTLVNILNNGGLSTEAEFGYDNVDGSLVVSSLTCTLNNERDEAILLTKCELYSNGSLLRSKSFSSNPVSVAAGGNKSCTFENLSKPANGTDFTVCWHYTVNGESFVYRCPLTD